MGGTLNQPFVVMVRKLLLACSNSRLAVVGIMAVNFPSVRHYVVMSEEELKALEQKADQTIEIEDFVPIATVDPLYFDRSTLLGPDRGGSKAFTISSRSTRSSPKGSGVRSGSRLSR